jgi:hypothetical protein
MDSHMYDTWCFTITHTYPVNFVVNCRAVAKIALHPPHTDDLTQALTRGIVSTRNWSCFERLCPMTAVNKPGAAALNVYIKVAIIRKADDVLTYEDGEGTIKTVTDLHLAAAVTVRPCV